jgi:phosphoglycolate phosphatase-like HAD superfamily hydrolase
MRPFSLTTLLLFFVLTPFNAIASEPLPSWNDSPRKRAIIEFVERVTAEGTEGYVAPAERIAVFDNDGTLWSEKPIYFQASFIFDRVRTMAPAHPEWQTQEPYASILKGDLRPALAGGERTLLELVMATHAGMTSDEFDKIARQWLASAKHPITGKPFTEMVYQPMLELLQYLRDHQFKTYIVTGGGIEFVRAFSESVYGIPPEQVVGSSIQVQYELRDGKPVLVRLPKLNFIDDKDGKPVGIQQHIGRRPIAAFGNSDGDFQMLQWTTAGTPPHLAMIVRHDDADREYAYDRNSSVGKLDKALDAADSQGWQIISMKDDWKVVYPNPTR